eukprot:scaffold66383_cov45-Phaeocystis_antarctica.AAC.2
MDSWVAHCLSTYRKASPSKHAQPYACTCGAACQRVLSILLCRSPLPGPPGTQGYGTRLLHALRRSLGHPAPRWRCGRWCCQPAS